MGSVYKDNDDFEVGINSCVGFSKGGNEDLRRVMCYVILI